jgi:adenine deaminase
MRIKNALLRSFVTVLMISGMVLARTQAPEPADLIIHNAKIHTVNAKQPRAEAIAIRGQRIAAVGSNADILKLKGPASRVIDAGGTTSAHRFSG